MEVRTEGEVANRCEATTGFVPVSLDNTFAFAAAIRAAMSLADEALVGVVVEAVDEGVVGVVVVAESKKKRKEKDYTMQREKTKSKERKVLPQRNTNQGEYSKLSSFLEFVVSWPETKRIGIFEKKKGRKERKLRTYQLSFLKSSLNGLRSRSRRSAG
jgi:hypothetical protein